MKAFIGLSLLCGLALASPVERRQELDLEGYEAAIAAAPTVVVPVGDEAPEESTAYDADKVAAVVNAQVTDAPDAQVTEGAQDVVIVDEIVKRAVCTTRTFNGPQVTVPTDSPEAFKAYQPFADAAVNAAKAANVPAGYAVVPGYVNLKASANSGHYLTYVSSKLDSYDTHQCAQICTDMAGCVSFTIFYTRVPLVISSTTQVPDSAICPATANSASATLIKCAFYGTPVKATEATNVGQFQGKFSVVFAGANAYSMSNAPSLDGYEGPVSFGSAAINAPAPVNENGYLRSQTFGMNVPFDPSLCAQSCKTQTEYNLPRGKPACIFFDAYILYKNGVDGIFTCAYYSTAYGGSYAKNVGQKNNQGDKWTIGSSYGYYVEGNFVPK